MAAYQDEAWEAMGDRTRRAIVLRLAERPQAVGELAADLPVSRPAVSQHLRVLKDVGLVTEQAVGTKRIYRLNEAPTRFSERQKGVVSGRMDSADGETPSVGDRCHTTRRIGFADRPSTSELVQFEPPHRWGVRGIERPVRAVVDLTVEPQGDQRSTLTISVDFEGRHRPSPRPSGRPPRSPARDARQRRRLQQRMENAD